MEQIARDLDAAVSAAFRKADSDLDTYQFLLGRLAFGIAKWLVYASAGDEDIIDKTIDDIGDYIETTTDAMIPIYREADARAEMQQRPPTLH